MEPLAVAFLLTLGLLFGSFLNVVIHRLPRAETTTSTWWVGYRCLVDPPRSRCPNCGHELRWYENIPLVSWLALRGRCSGCGTRISARYPMVELLTGLLFVACFVRFGLSWPLVPALVMMVLVVPLVFIDAEHWILPFELTLPGIALGIGLSVPLGVDAVRAALIGAVGGFLGFRALEFIGWWLFRKEALGAGDKYLLALLGAFLGWRALVGVLFLSSVQGAVFGVLSLALRGRAGPETMPPERMAEPAPVAPSGEPLSPAPSAPDAPPGAPVSAPNPSSTEAAEATAGSPPASDADDEVFTFTPDFLRPDVSLPRRLALLPWTLFFQPIPDDPAPSDDDEGAQPEWTPGVTSLPFGPWIGLAGIEVLLLTPWLHATFAGTPFGMTMELLFGAPTG